MTRAQKKAAATRRGWLIMAVVAVIAAFVGWQFIEANRERRTLDENLCPAAGEDSLTVLLVDLTDPLSLAQKQDFLNQLESLRNSVPKFGRLSIYKVDAASTELLKPVLDLCNPGDGSDVTEGTGNPVKARKIWLEKYEKPVGEAFASLMKESGAEVSPIFESVQSVALTQLQRPGAKQKPRKLVLVSDLLQNTPGLSFYRGLPSAEELKQSPTYASAKTDLRGVEMELWMLSRPSAQELQNSRLIELWQELLGAQGARVIRAYNVSG